MLTQRTRIVLRSYLVILSMVAALALTTFLTLLGGVQP